MATIKVGDCVWIRDWVERVCDGDMAGSIQCRWSDDDYGIVDGEPCFSVTGLENVLIDHPALPKLAALLTDPAFVDNIIEAAQALEGLADDFAETSGESSEDAPPLVAMRKLAAALTEGADGNA